MDTLDNSCQKKPKMVGAILVNLYALDTVENSERDGNTRPPDLPLEKILQVRKQQLELDREQQTGSK